MPKMDMAALQNMRSFVGQTAGAIAKSMFGPTGIYRQYYNRIPEDPHAPIDASSWEEHVCEAAGAAIKRIQERPWHPHVLEAMHATAKLRTVIQPFLPDYESEHEHDTLPSLWSVE